MGKVRKGQCATDRAHETADERALVRVCVAGDERIGLGQGRGCGFRRDEESLRPESSTHRRCPERYGVRYTQLRGARRHYRRGHSLGVDGGGCGNAECERARPYHGKPASISTELSRGGAMAGLTVTIVCCVGS